MKVLINVPNKNICKFCDEMIEFYRCKFVGLFYMDDKKGLYSMYEFPDYDMFLTYFLSNQNVMLKWDESLLFTAHETSS